MCTVKSQNEVMVCDVSRDRVRELLAESVGSAVRISTVHGEGTRFECGDPERLDRFQDSIRAALGWTRGADGFADADAPGRA